MFKDGEIDMQSTQVKEKLDVKYGLPEKLLSAKLVILQINDQTPQMSLYIIINLKINNSIY